MRQIFLSEDNQPISQLRGRPSASPDAVADTVVLGKQLTRLRMRLQPATHKDAPVTYTKNEYPPLGDNLYYIIHLLGTKKLWFK